VQSRHVSLEEVERVETLPITNTQTQSSRIDDKEAKKVNGRAEKVNCIFDAETNPQALKCVQ